MLWCGTRGRGYEAEQTGAFVGSVLDQGQIIIQSDAQIFEKKTKFEEICLHTRL